MGKSLGSLLSEMIDEIVVETSDGSILKLQKRFEIIKKYKPMIRRITKNDASKVSTKG